MHMPITSTTTTLTLDKLPYSFPTEAITFTPNEASKRSVRILKELWGDLVEEVPGTITSLEQEQLPNNHMETKL
jgi:hypothetical protein